jgi:DNA-nicking Smr family endonuclease
MTASDEDNDLLSDEPWNEEIVEMPIDGVLDLHTFSPKEVKELLGDYLAACLEREIYDVRIIHGKGKGILRDRVRALLAKHPSVEGFHEAPLEAGGWGATVVRLRSD